MRFIHRLIRNLILPNNAGPGDAQIFIGPDVPTCMQSTYAAIIMFMPTTWNSGIGAPPTRYLGIRSTLSAGATAYDNGWLIWNQGAVCSFVATDSWRALNDGAGGLAMTVDISNELIGTAITSFTTNIGNPSGATSDTFLKRNTVVDLSQGGDFTSIDTNASSPVEMPRGFRYIIMSTGNSGAIGTSFSTVLTSTTDMIWRTGLCYEVIIGGGLLGSVANQGNFVLNHIVGVSESSIIDFRWSEGVTTAEGRHVNCRQLIKNATGSDITSTEIKLYIRSSTGTVTHLGAATAVAGSPRYIEIRHVGAAADYPSAINL